MKKKIKFGLIPRIIVAIILGVLIGQFLPDYITRVFVTASDLFSNFLAFVIPLMIMAFIIKGIADLTNGAGKLLGITTLLAYTSTVIAGGFALFVSFKLIPNLVNPGVINTISSLGKDSLQPYFTIDMPPFMDITSALVFSFIMGLCISKLRSENKIGDVSYSFFSEFSDIIVRLLETIIIPLIPLFVLGTFADMAYTGKVYAILSVLWKVFVAVIAMHLIYLVFLFFVSGLISKKNPIFLLKNQITGYVTALGTQSSAATIPVNIKCAEKNGTTTQIREFVIPLCATIHLAGSIITIITCITSVLMMYQMPCNAQLMIPLLFTLGIVMVAAPGVPGGAIMAALPFLSMVGISSDSAIASLLIALYITQDSFGTATNVSGDNAIAVIVDTIYKKWLCKDKK